MALGRRDLAAILLFPGLLGGALLVEQALLRPRAEQRSTDDRVEFWRRHVERHPGFPPSQVGLGQALSREGLLEEAERAYRRALREDPDFQEAAIGLNEVLRRRHGPEAARAQMERFLEQSPSCRPCKQNLAADLLQLGEADRAQGLVDELLASRSYAMDMYGRRSFGGSRLELLAGRVYAENGQPEKALEFFDALPGDPTAAYLAAVTQMEIDPDDAEARWRRYEELAPDDPRPDLLRARARIDAGRLDEAGELLEQGRALAATISEGAVRREWLHAFDYERARIEARDGRTDRAIRLLHRLLREDPDQPRAARLLARLEAPASGSAPPDPP